MSAQISEKDEPSAPARSAPLYCARRVQQLFPPEQQPQVFAFLADVRARLSLSRKHTEQMLCDHLSALDCLIGRGLSLEEAMRKLSPAKLSDFYLVERKDWYPLDHAAKVYPMSMSLKRMMVFRLSGYLKEPVVPPLLQMALNHTVRRFPYFATTIKCGFFWHYTDSAMRRFAVKPETKLPCAVMKLGNVTSPAFRVVYYENRVSVEFFHILTDGTGASIFLSTLLQTYLRLLGYDVPAGAGMFHVGQKPSPEEWRDDFTIGDPAPESHGFADKPALQMRGMLPYEQPNRVLHFHFSTQGLLACARAHGVSITALLLGCMFLACKDACPCRKTRKRIQIQLPVNMRRFYPSHTLRNFSMYCVIRLHPDEIRGLEDILPLIAAQIAQGTAKQALDQTMQLSRKLVKYLRFVPLIVKRPLSYLIYGALSDSVFTTTFSNLGVVQASPEMSALVEKFDFVLGAPIQNRACCSLCSFGDCAVFTVTKNTQLTLFEDSLYQRFCELGLEPMVEGSM
ncbi:MAG: hypothetical protein RR865_05560 [Clostridia bacterium]